MKHTKGPWEICSDKINVFQPELDLSITNTSSFWAVESFDEQEANARLISCAPEMLDYLIDYLKSRLTGIVVKQEFFNANPKLVNLIEKATGMKIEEVLKCQSLSE